jgi:hypothetical protein
LKCGCDQHRNGSKPLTFPALLIRHGDTRQCAFVRACHPELSRLECDGSHRARICTSHDRVRIHFRGSRRDGKPASASFPMPQNSGRRTFPGRSPPLRCERDSIPGQTHAFRRRPAMSPGRTASLTRVNVHCNDAASTTFCPCGWRWWMTRAYILRQNPKRALPLLLSTQGTQEEEHAVNTKLREFVLYFADISVREFDFLEVRATAAASRP